MINHHPSESASKNTPNFMNFIPSGPLIYCLNKNFFKFGQALGLWFHYMLQLGIGLGLAWDQIRSRVRVSISNSLSGPPRT